MSGTLCCKGRQAEGRGGRSRGLSSRRILKIGHQWPRRCRVTTSSAGRKHADSRHPIFAGGSSSHPAPASQHPGPPPAPTCVTKQTLSAPRTAMAVRPLLLAALKAYSTWYSRPSGEKMVLHGGQGRETGEFGQPQLCISRQPPTHHPLAPRPAPHVLTCAYRSHRCRATSATHIAGVQEACSQGRERSHRCPAVSCHCCCGGGGGGGERTEAPRQQVGTVRPTLDRPVLIPSRSRWPPGAAESC